MAETTSSLLQILLMETGGRNNDWGDQTNANLSKIEDAIAGQESIASTGGTTTLTADQARPAILSFSGTLTSDHIAVVPNLTKTWLVYNGHTLGAFALTMKTASGSAITIPSGGPYLVYCAGSDIVRRTAEGADMAANTVKANITGSSATPTDVPYAALAAKFGYLPAPNGTAMIFKQTAAPTGWTKDTSNNNNSALRVVTGTASTGGTADFTTAFAARTIATENLPAHTHSGTVDSDGAHTHGFTYYQAVFNDVSGGGGKSSAEDAQPGTTVSGGAHTHTFTTSSVGSGTAMDFAVKYVDVIQAAKDATA